MMGCPSGSAQLHGSNSESITRSSLTVHESRFTGPCAVYSNHKIRCKYKPYTYDQFESGRDDTLQTKVLLHFIYIFKRTPRGGRRRANEKARAVFCHCAAVDRAHRRPLERPVTLQFGVLAVGHGGWRAPHRGIGVRTRRAFALSLLSSLPESLR